MQTKSRLSKCLVVGIILLFILTAITPTNGQKIEKQSPPDSRGNILYVGGSGPGNYTKIQDAINNASNGDTVFVYDDSAPYNETVTVTKSIYLCGENRTSTIIKGEVNLNANDTTISYFTIDNHLMHYQFSGPVLHNMTISHNMVQWFFYFEAIKDLTISSNTFDMGTDVRFCSRVNITGNTISDEEGCYLLGSNNCTISHNNLTNANVGVYLEGECQHMTIVGNTFSHCGDLILSWGTSYMDIRRNNFINNRKKDFGIDLTMNRWVQVVENNFINSTVSCSWAWWGFHVVWDRNYWGHPRLLPKPIYNRLRFFLRYLLVYIINRGPWEPQYPYIVLVPFSLKYDWHPAQQPYDIP
ncbi:MAG TPA: right-handed parallel beta-helix repeat-containing protein [Candidatus Thermoplasmatota archaeon]|nr:right-handed parallel beta-helix repeat-containing protein [Candidatus Thermoplasmatota archaeon]